TDPFLFARLSVCAFAVTNKLQSTFTGSVRYPHYVRLTRGFGLRARSGTNPMYITCQQKYDKSQRGKWENGNGVASKHLAFVSHFGVRQRGSLMKQPGLLHAPAADALSFRCRS